MNTMPTYRKGGRVYRPGPKGGEGACGSFCSVLFLSILLCAPPVLLLMSESSRYNTFMALSEAIGSDILSFHDPRNAKGKMGAAPSFAHGTSESIKSTVSDQDMGVTIPGALLLHRRTEYCQWQEIRREECRKCSRTVTARDGSKKEETYDCDCVTYYDYVKSWKNHRVNSMMFNRPAAHHNPQRDPMPSVKIPSADAVLDFDIDGPDKGSKRKSAVKSVALDPSMLSNSVRGAKWRAVNWVLGGIPQPSFFNRHFPRWFPDHTRYERINELHGIDRSPAATRDNFIYVGQGGYFFSAYESSMQSSMFKYFMQYVEGTLFDWQLGDLMPSCTAGDVRFRYEVQDPAVVSVLGETVMPKKKGAAQVLNTRKMSNGESVGLVHVGYKTPDEMIAAADSDSFWSAMLPRALLLIWAIPFSRLLGAFLGKEVSGSSSLLQFASVIGVSFCLLGSAWAFQWGMSVDVTFALVLGAIGLSMTTSPNMAKSSSPGGLNATWCMLARWAGAPPDWRMEDSYEGGTYVEGTDSAADPKADPVKPTAPGGDYFGEDIKKD
mmetsp:Transcript_44014/g.66305  ORF Transcript_44014/g.66305 Transcript_44014/m.66305 type:complete len:550 (-) Transcript_44014:177-1826(-)